MKISTMIAGAALACAALPAWAAPDCAPNTPQEARVVEDVIRAFYREAASERVEAAARLTTPDFYAYEGERQSWPQLYQSLADARARGVVIQWNLGPIDVRLGCDMAWAAWENHGAAGKPPEVKPVTWLESMALTRVDGAWRIAFLHAHRIQVK